jgi:hypothetical protein
LDFYALKFFFDRLDVAKFVTLKSFASTSVYCSFVLLDSPLNDLLVDAFVALVIEFGSKPSNSDCTHRFSFTNVINCYSTFSVDKALNQLFVVPSKNTPVLPV